MRIHAFVLTVAVLSMSLGAIATADPLSQTGGVVCHGPATFEFAPNLAVSDQRGTVTLTLTGPLSCTGVFGSGAAGEECPPDVTCLCPVSDPGPCVVHAENAGMNPLQADYFGSCVRAFIDGGRIDVVGGVLVTGFGLGTHTGEKPNLISVDGVLVAEGGNPCAMARGHCNCTTVVAGVPQDFLPP